MYTPYFALYLNNFQNQIDLHNKGIIFLGPQFQSTYTQKSHAESYIRQGKIGKKYYEKVIKPLVDLCKKGIENHVTNAYVLCQGTNNMIRGMHEGIFGNSKINNELECVSDIDCAPNWHMVKNILHNPKILKF